MKFVQSLYFCFCVFLCGLSLLFAANPMVEYTFLSESAAKSGQLAYYDDIPKTVKTLTLGDYKLKFSVPEQIKAYDVVPIRYTLFSPDAAGESHPMMDSMASYFRDEAADSTSDTPRYVAIQAVAFEDAERSKGKTLYDLAIPGDMKVKIEYLGSIGANYLDDTYIPLTTDPKTPVSPFPPFKRGEFIKSSTISASDLIWFKFKITNVGNTILDPEGFSGCLAEPFIYKIDDDGKRLWQGKPINLFTRHLEYVYPGESYEQWVNFNCPQLGRNGLGLSEGKYEIVYRMLCRFYDEYDWMVNIWSGTEFARLEVPVTVTNETAPITPVEAKLTVEDTTHRMPRYFSSFEEFMTSFKIFSDEDTDKTHQGTMYLQVAPWTQEIVVKLITKEPKSISSVRVPVKLDNSSLDIKYNPDNIMVISKDGRQEPVFMAQLMPAMRLSMNTPYLETYLRDTLKEAKDLGVNVVVNTAGDWWIPEISGSKQINMSSAAYKYFYDVLARDFDMKLLGWSVYPPSMPHWYQHAENLVGKKLTFATQSSGYTSGSETEVTSVDMADPVVSEMLVAWVDYQYKRWGDLWFRAKDGRIPIDIEDTWGWMRDDINIRMGLGQLGLGRFREWLKDKYETIDKLNNAWGSNCTDFEEVSPMADQIGMHGGYSYDNKESVFYDWNTAINDFDEFRTILRLDMMQKTNEMIQEIIPGAELAVRTEGANLPIKGDGQSDTMHWRHVYYSQRRNAFVYDVIKEKDVLHFYSDYTTLPYTPKEWRQAMKEMVADGIIPMFLPQFDHMRDIVLNPYYGRDYQMHYDLEEPSKGIMIHCLMAAYPWWKATYEEGGAPGILWSDYLCDGFATETQKRELKLLTKHFNSMKRN